MQSVTATQSSLKRRQLPKLYACQTKLSLDNFRNKALYSLDVLDAKAIRRLQISLHECLIKELKETGYVESSTFLQNIMYDNEQLVNDDDLGIVVDLKKRKDYLELICENLQKIEKEHDKGNLKKESLLFLNLALFFMESEKGNLWLAEKLFLVAIAVASQLLTDGGRQKACCKYYYAKFLLDKFPGLDDEEPFNILTDVRNAAIGKDWLLNEDEEARDYTTVFNATALQMYRVLTSLSKKFRLSDTPRAERLARLAERRAQDANVSDKVADAIIQIGLSQLLMNNLKNAQKTFARALKLHNECNNIDGICETKMHLATVMQRMNEHNIAEKLLTEMGILAMDNGLRRHLGRALHLLGELHVMREKPELGTQYLCEAFTCFMGFKMIPSADQPGVDKRLSVQFDPGNLEKLDERYVEEAERSRLMAAVCNGQEIMASYFNLLREADVCTLARVKTMEWKLNKQSWWIPTSQHNFQSCPCPVHHRSPLDVLHLKMSLIQEEISRPESMENTKERRSYITKM